MQTYGLLVLLPGILAEDNVGPILAEDNVGPISKTTMPRFADLL